MKKGLFLSLAIFILLGTSLGQVPSTPAGAQAQNQSSTGDSVGSAALPNMLMSGTVLSVELSKSLDARKNKVNDKVEAKTATDVLSHGRIVVPRNTKIIGHVTEAKAAHGKSSPDSVLGIAFDHMLLKGGREVPLQASVQAIARPLPPSRVGSEPDTLSDLSTRMPGQRSAPAGDSSSSTITPRYPTTSIPEPPSPNSRDLPSTSTISPLGPTSHGVIGMKGLSLNTSGPASVLSSNTDNVHLDSGAQLILRVQ
jgi:hypothetical protein